MSDSEAVELAIEAMVSETARVTSKSASERTFFQIRAALAIGYQKPLTPKQRAMNTMLTKLKAAKASYEQAWITYHKLRS